MRTIIVLLALVTSPVLGIGQVWEDLADIPVDLTFPVVVELNGKIHVMGGGGSNGASALHYAYDPSTDMWEAMANTPYLAQQPGGAVVNGKIHYLGGGFPNSGSPLKHHYVYDPGTDSWSQAPDLPANRVIHKVAAVGDKLYVMGGQPDKLRFEVYDATDSTWTSLNSLPDQNFWYSAIAVADGTIYRFGGGGYTAPTDAAHRYNASIDSWISLEDLPDANHSPDAAAIGDKVYISGGYFDFEESTDVWEFDPDNEEYTSMTPLPVGRSYHNMVSIDTCLYVVCGNNALDDSVGFKLIRLCPGDTFPPLGIAPSIVSSSIEIFYINHQLVIASKDRQQANLAIYDVKGSLLFQESIVLGEQLVIETGLTQSGLYIVEINTPDGRFTKKIIHP